MIFHALGKNKNAYYNFFEIMTCAIESTKLIKEHDKKIDKMEALEREYANDIASVKEALEEEQTTKESLEETFALELSRVKETHDREIEVANGLRIKNDKLVFGHAKLLEDFEHLKNGSRALRVSSSNSPSRMSNLKLLIQKSLPSCLLIMLVIMMLVPLALLHVKHLF